MFDGKYIELTQYYDGSLGISLEGWSDSDYRPILMQYTGLKDKNGLEIYEGDIVKQIVFYKNFNKEYPHNQSTRIVKWVNSSKFVGFGIGKGKWEVVGNIYQNPQLLTTEVGEEGK